ncbi:hypothetical protein BDZ94DRAFT_1268579 [Collybia nuda]|uniref:Uncharacterized protein n=1 Tax=Collybia nuda TaxID=64659 RepID=A0A9P6CFU2_9AGAR|nr:hypothetical protein BDZ94DRAFT_1268579 [Collybia nuda]
MKHHRQNSNIRTLCRPRYHNPMRQVVNPTPVFPCTATAYACLLTHLFSVVICRRP